MVLHTCQGICGSSADNPANVQCVVIGSCAKSTQGHFRFFFVFEDSTSDCESKNLSRATFMIANPPGRVTVDPSGTFFTKLSWSSGNSVIQQRDGFVDEQS